MFSSKLSLVQWIHCLLLLMHFSTDSPYPPPVQSNVKRSFSQKMQYIFCPSYHRVMDKCFFTTYHILPLKYFHLKDDSWWRFLHINICCELWCTWWYELDIFCSYVNCWYVELLTEIPSVLLLAWHQEGLQSIKTPSAVSRCFLSPELITLRQTMSWLGQPEAWLCKRSHDFVCVSAVLNLLQMNLVDCLEKVHLGKLSTA